MEASRYSNFAMGSTRKKLLDAVEEWEVNRSCFDPAIELLEEMNSSDGVLSYFTSRSEASHSDLDLYRQIRGDASVILNAARYLLEVIEIWRAREEFEAEPQMLFNHFPAHIGAMMESNGHVVVRSGDQCAAVAVGERDPVEVANEVLSSMNFY